MKEERTIMKIIVNWDISEQVMRFSRLGHLKDGYRHEMEINIRNRNGETYI